MAKKPNRLTVETLKHARGLGYIEQRVLNMEYKGFFDASRERVKPQKPPDVPDRKIGFPFSSAL
jgi:hypothetical protein